MTLNPEVEQYVEIGTRIGRGQAFGMLAQQSLTASVECLRQIHDSEEYKSLGLTWEEFCEKYAGMSKRNADRLIAYLEEFGAAYFRLSEIVRVSPETYRQIAPKMDGEVIEIEGEKVVIAPENLPRIRTAILRLRSELQNARKPQMRSLCDISGADRLMNQAVGEITRQSDIYLEGHQKAALIGIADYAIRRLTKVRDRLKE
ncbi:MAG TPA: hypothetical protein VMH81_39295 [Bryobacteraceae bacterium]|nr:hypothetical protein [Bryobacteraceae bacterium]